MWILIKKPSQWEYKWISQNRVNFSYSFSSKWTSFTMISSAVFKNFAHFELWWNYGIVYLIGVISLKRMVFDQGCFQTYMKFEILIYNLNEYYPFCTAPFWLIWWVKNVLKKKILNIEYWSLFWSLQPIYMHKNLNKP